MQCDDYKAKVDYLTTHNNKLTKINEDAFEKLNKIQSESNSNSNKTNQLEQELKEKQ